MTNKKSYKKSGGAGAHGVDYQINILSLFLLEAYEDGDEFFLSTENDSGGKFDDVVLETNKKTILLQAKHKEDPKDKKNLITYNDIFPCGKNRDDFNLHKYIKYFPNIKKSFDNINSLILCTNTNLSGKQDSINNYICCKKPDRTDIFSFCNQNSCYVFNQECKNLLLEENSNLTEEDVNLFLEKLQLIFVGDEDLNKRIENLMEENDLFDATVDIKQSTSFLRENIKTWFKNKKGLYLTRLHVEALRSQYFIEQLGKMNIFFITSLPLDTQYSCYIIQQEININIHLLRIYQNLQDNKTLMINPDDKTHVKIQVIPSFIIEDFVYLIIPIFKDDLNALKKTIKNIVKDTSDKSYKKIIFVTNNNDILMELNKYLNIQIKEFNQKIQFEDFPEKTQELLCSKNVIFQGKSVSLKEVVYPHAARFNEILDEETLVKLIYEKEKIVINEHYDENVPQFYVERLVNYINADSLEVTSSEEELSDVIAKDDHNKMVLILDGPGMGKSTILSRLQQLLNKKYNFWIVRINLNDCFKIFTECIENSLKVVTLEQLIESKRDIRLNTFEKNILNLPKNVIVMLDAFDEIGTLYYDLILNLIKSCENEENIRKVVITSRPHCQSYLTNCMEPNQFSLNTFTSKDQSKFLTNFWTTKLNLSSDEINNCQVFVNKIMSILTKSIKQGHWNIIGIPLQCQIIAEIFLEDCRNYIQSNSFSSDTFKKFEDLNIADIYDMFIKIKKKIYFNEKSRAGGNPILINLLEKHFDRAVKEHTRMALKQILYVSEYNRFKELQTLEGLSETELLDVGILQKKNSIVHFTHQTFAEYLAALHLCETLDRKDIQNEFLHFLIGDILLKKRFTTLHLFMNFILQKKSIRPESIKKIGKVTSEINVDFKGHVNVLVQEGHYYLLKLMLQECDNFENILSDINLLIFLSGSNFSVFQLLLEKGANIFATYAGYNLLHSVSHHSKEVLEYLIKNGLNINAKDRQGYTPLLRSIPMTNKMQILIDNNADVAIKNFYQESALHIACVYNAVDALPILIETGLDINDIDRYGCTPILRACSFKSYHCVKYLLDNGADISAVDNDYCNMLHYLAMDVVELNYYNLYDALRTNRRYTLEHRDLLIQEIMKLILEKGCIDVDSVCKKSMTALHQAAASDNVTIANLLLEAGADKEIKNDKGVTPLFVGLLRQKYNCANLLIDKGADITASDSEGCDILHYLAKIKDIRNITLYTEIVTKIIQSNTCDVNSICKQKVTALHHAVIANNLIMTNLLLTKNADKNIRNIKGKTPLLTACLQQKYDCANYLIDNDVGDKDNDGCDVLHYLAKIEFVRDDDLFTKFVTNLLQHHSDKINNVCRKGMTPLHHAVKAENLIMTKLLLAAGAEKEIKNLEGATALLIACCQEEIDCAKLLIDNEANITATDNEGRNILHYLSGVKYISNLDLYVEIARKVIDENKDKVNAVSGESMTPLHYAVLASNNTMLELLLTAGANAEIKNNKGATALLLACGQKRISCAKYLLDRKADTSAVDDDGCDILHYLAVRKKYSWSDDVYVEIVKQVLKKNFDRVNNVCKIGMSIKDHAASARNDLIINVLVQAGAMKKFKITRKILNFVGVPKRFK